MHVTVTFVGVLGRLIHEGSFEVVLPGEATCRDLMAEIRNRFGESLPEPLWDCEANKFKEPIFALVNGSPVDSLGLFLKDGDDVKFLTLVAGG
ncbi:MAG: ThiS family protein [Syntrophaceae bacterium PtaB.Bin095]|nr:MAG: ThiS family protein [Syntrophaceae bacterium PtaB.Bin095]